MLKQKGDINMNLIMSFCKDILRYLESKENEEYKTNQHFIRMKDLFRGYMIIDWEEINIQYKKYRYLNTIITKECVKFYNKY